MNLAKMSANGQITVPQEIRQELELKPGDKIVFLHNAAGEITVQNLAFVSKQLEGTKSKKTT